MVEVPANVRICDKHPSRGGVGSTWQCPDCVREGEGGGGDATPKDRGRPSCDVPRPADQRSPAPSSPRTADGSETERALGDALTLAGLIPYETQYPFARALGRRYRADYAYPDARLLVEVEGQVHSIKRQRHADCERASIAAALGWRMVRVTREMIESGTAVELVDLALRWERR